MDTQDDRPMRQSDHDLLVVIHTKVERVITDVRDLSANVTGRISVLEETKADKTEIQDLKSKDIQDMKADVRWLQRIAYGGLGILATIQFYYNVIKK